MEQFASGWKRSYYGKGDVTAFRLNRDGVTAGDQSAVFGANVKLLVYGDAFWPTYTTGDNTGLVATDSMKNFIQRETLNYAGPIWKTTAAFSPRSFWTRIRRWKGRRFRRPKCPSPRCSRTALHFRQPAPNASLAALN